MLSQSVAHLNEFYRHPKITLVPQLHLDHQQLKFEIRDKFFAWMSTTRNMSNFCNQFQLISFKCNNMVVNNFTTSTQNATILSTYLSNSSYTVFLKILAMNSETSRVCQEIRPLLVVEQNCKFMISII